MIKSIYVIGSLRNESIPRIGNSLREVGIDVFDDWYAAGPEADDYWKKYEQGRGRTYEEALEGYAVRNVFSFDKTHLNRVDAGLLVLPAGKSGHLELGYITGLGKPSFILVDDVDRWDAMYRFATKVFFSEKQMIEYFEPKAIEPGLDDYIQYTDGTTEIGRQIITRDDLIDYFNSTNYLD